MVNEWSLEDDSLLSKDRLALLDTPPGGLKLKTDGYQWYKENNFKPNRIFTVTPRGRYTVSEDPQFLLGKVDNLWLVASSNLSSTSSLKEAGKKRFEERKVPTVSTFDEYKRMRQSCYILEEREGDLFCDCYLGMKGKLCKHGTGLLYRTGKLEVTSEVRSVKLGQKRKRGRPKKLRHCLVRSPVPSVAADEPAENLSKSPEPMQMSPLPHQQ